MTHFNNYRMIYDKILVQFQKIGVLFILFSTTLHVSANHSQPIPSNDTLSIKKYIEKSKLYDSPEYNYPDSSLYYINLAQKLSEKLNYDNYLYDINQQFVRIFISTRNYPMALEYSFKNLDSLESRNSSEKSIRVINQYIPLLASIGIIYFQLDIDLSLFYLEKAEKLILEYQDRLTDSGTKLNAIYNNIGSVYLQKGELDTARKTYQKSLLYLEEKKENDYSRSAIYNNLGIIDTEQEKYEEALAYYDKSLSIRKNLNDKEGIAQVYNNMGRCYYTQKNYGKAVELLEKSIRLSKETHNFRSEIIGIGILSAIYNEKKMYKEEALLNKRESELKDSIFEQENRGRIIELGIKYEYEKQRKYEELEQHIILAKKEKNILILIITISILSLLCLTSALLYRNLKIKAKRDKLQSDSLTLQSKNLELEKQNLLLRNSRLEEEVEGKNKELTTHVMYLVQKNQFIISITDKLSELINESARQPNKQKINTIIKQMKANVDKTAWEEFEIRFQQIHSDFYAKLNKKIPNLTPNEKRLCAFLYLNMTTKEISSVTFQSIKSIEVARTRLRKKLDIERDDNLISVLQSL